MEKSILVVASFYKQSYYYNDIEYEAIPAQVKKELMIICTTIAEKIKGVFIIGFYSNGDVFLESKGDEDDFNYDEIKAQYEIQQVIKKEDAFFQKLTLWHAFFIGKGVEYDPSND